MEEIVLTFEDSLNSRLEELPSETHLGSKKAHLKHDNLVLRIAQKPITCSLRELYLKANKPVPPDMEVFDDNFRLWMITHVVSVVKEKDSVKDITRLVYEVQFPPASEVSTVQVLPQTEFIKKIGVEPKINWVFDVGLGVNGQIVPPAVVTELMNQTDFVSFGGKAQVKIDISNTLNLVGNLSFSVITPKIVATGIGDNYCRWEFIKDNTPLIGDHLMVQILLVPINTETLQFQSRVSATTTVLKFLPKSRKSRWTEMTTNLPRGR